MRVRGNEKNRGGFSLAEVLIVVAILGILLAIALPNVLAAYRQLRLTELDDSARTIFVAAQNQLSALVAQGRDLKSAVGGETVANSPLKAAGGGGPATPATQTLYFISNNDSLHSSGKNDGLHNILAGLSIDNELQLHNYVIEYCPDTGAVYAVWYWEDAKFDYSKEAYKPFSSDKNARLKSGRLIGYYGGDKIDRTPYGQLPLPKVELINAEELRLRISVPVDVNAGANIGDLDENLRVDVRINEQTIIKGAKVQTLTNAGTNYYTVVLDTLYGIDHYNDDYKSKSTGWTYGMRFCEWTDVNNKPLSANPGEDITVTVVLWYAEAGHYLPQIVRVTGNSLFASVWTTQDGKKVANIAYGRHLQNLDEGYDLAYPQQGGTYLPRPGSGVTKTGIGQATQIRDINFAMPNPDLSKTEDNVYYWASTYPDKKFQTIYDEHLEAYDGQQFEIRNINIEDVAGYCGLFNVPYSAAISRLALEDITLINAKLYDSHENGLIGGFVASDYSAPLTIKGCKIYNEYDANKKDSEAVEKLLKDGSFSLNGLKVDESNLVYKDLLEMPGMIAKNALALGGFVGVGGVKVEVEDSSISTIMVGTTVGGMIGIVGGDLTTRRAYCANFSCGSTVGGVFGNVTVSNIFLEIENCYAAGEIMNGLTSNPGSFEAAGVSIQTVDRDTYATFKMENVYSAVRYVNPEKGGRFYGTIPSPDTKGTNVYYLPQSGVEYNKDVTGAGEPITESKLKELAGTEGFTADNGWYVPTGTGTSKENPKGVTFPYRLLSELKNDDSLTVPYPYPMLHMTGKENEAEPHYGDWLENNSNLFLLYYEKYQGGGYGFYSAAVEPDATNSQTVTALVNTLKAATTPGADDPLVVDDGYLLVSAIDMDNQKYTVDGTAEKTLTATTLDTEMENALEDLPIFDDVTGDLHVYDLKFDENPISGIYTTVTVGGRSFAVNPHFACEAFDVTELMPPVSYYTFYDKPGVAGVDDTSGNPVDLPGKAGTTSTEAVVIRSPRHLVNLSKYTRDNSVSTDAQKWPYIQLLDVDFDAWEKDLAGKSDTNRLYPIRLRDGGSYTGNQFRIENIYIGPENGTDTLVGLFDEVSGTTKLEGIRMHNASVKAESTTVTALGGLVGQVSGGTVTDCGIYVDRDQYTNGNTTEFSVKNDQGNPVGGLIGEISNGTVEKSFAAVMLFSGANGTCGGFVGKMSGGTVTDCYAGGYTVNGKYVDNSDGYNVSAGTGGTAGGFVGEYAGGTFGGVCYSTCSTSGENVGRFAGKVNSGSTIVPPTDGMLYGIGKMCDTGTPNSEPYLTGKTAALDRSKTANFQTHPYDDALYAKEAGTTNPDPSQPLTFPYRTNLQEHYGDWVEPLMACYVERYADDPSKTTDPKKYGVYSAQVDSADANGIKAAMNTLAGERLVVADGYFLLSAVELTLDTNSDLVRVDSNSSNKVINDDTLTVEGESYYVYTFNDDKQPLRADGNYYTVYTYNGDQYYFNFDLACEAFAIAQGVEPKLNEVLKKPDAKAQGDPPAIDDVEGAAIRSARQLAQLGINTNDGTKTAKLLQGLHYTQLVCVNYAKYEPTLMPEIKTSAAASGVYNHVPITLKAGAEYDGTGHTVRNVEPGTLVDGTLAESGLFGHVSGATLKEIVLINAKVEVTGNSAVMSNGEVTTSSGPASGTDVLDPAKVTVNSNTFNQEVNGITFEGFGVTYATDGNTEIDGETFKNYIQIDRKMDVSGGSFSNTIKFKIDKPTTLKIWWSINKQNVPETKTVGIKKYDETNKTLSTDFKESDTRTGNRDKGFTFEIKLEDAGTYCLGADTGGFRLYKIEVITGPSTVEGNKPEGATMPDGGVYAGALAGLVDGSATVENCGVYVDADSNNTNHADIDSAYDHFQVSNEYNTLTSVETEGVGGLLGRADGATVSTCFAAVKVTGVHFVGGFVGSLSGGTVENCYAGGHTVNGSYQIAKVTSPGNYDTEPVINILATDGADTGVGGFAGLVDGSVIFTGTNYTTCSVALNEKAAITEVSKFAKDDDPNDTQVNRVTKGTSIGMFFGRVKVGVTVTTDDAINYATGTLFVKGESVKRNATFKTPENIVVYAWDGTDKKWEPSEKQNIQYVTADEVYTNQYVTMLDPVSRDQTDVQYDPTLKDQYPYELAGDQPHHGDWTERLNLVYYEVYDNARKIEVEKPEELVKAIEDKKIGFYGELRGGRVINTLKYDGSIVYDSGYMVVNDRDADLGPLDIQLRSYYSKEGETNKNHYNSETIMKSVDVTSATGLDWANYVYVIPFSVLNIAPSDHYYMLAFVNGVSYVFNPHFAGEAVNVGILGSKTKADLKTGIDLDEVLNKIREKPGFTAAKDKLISETGIVIRTSWNFSSLARYCRVGNNGNSKSIVQNAQIVQQMNLDYSEATGYRYGRVYDGNENNRYRVKSSDSYDHRSGANFVFAHVPVILGDEGVYDGQNHTISNIYLANDSGKENNYAGLFVLKGATVKNLELKDSFVNGEKTATDVTKIVYAGGIAAYMEGDARIENVDVTKLTFDFHRLPTYKEESPRSNSKWQYDEINITPLQAVGGAVGMMKGGTLENVTLNGVTMTFDGDNGRDYYGIHCEDKEQGDKAKLTQYSLDTEQKGDNVKIDPGSVSLRSAIDDSKPISIGGAIGEIKSDGTIVTVTGVTVTDPLIKANKGKDNSVGGFVGKADGGEFKNYTSSAKDTDTRTVTITNSGVYLDANKEKFDDLDVVGVKSDAKGDDTVGGFAGQLGVNVAVEGDYSAIRVQGRMLVGGFAGKITGSHVENCYSGGHTDKQAYSTTNYNVVGSESGAVVGGFAGSIDMGFQSGSSGPSALYMTGINYTTSSAQAANGTVGKFVGKCTGTDGLLAKMGSLKPINYATGAVDGKTTTDNITEKYIPNRDPSKSSDFKTYPYDTPLAGQSYPYGTNLSVHHGDWPDTIMTSGIAYWDEMDDGEFRVQVAGIDVTANKLLDNEQIYSNLCDETHMKTNSDTGNQDVIDHKIVASGYALFSSGKDAETRLGELTKQVTGLKETPHTDDSGIQQAVSQALAAMCPGENVSGAVIRVYNTPETGKADAQELELYTSTSDEEKVYYTVGFGGVSYDENFGQVATAPFLIRTLQQLDNIPDNTNAFFQQGHDLYGEGNTTFTGAKDFSGGYDGRGYRVLDLNISTKDSGKNAALFESVKDATLQGIILFNRAGGGAITSGGSVAAGIVASVSGDVTMKNCAVAGYVFDEKTFDGSTTVTGTDRAVGPLVGVVENGGKLTVATSQAVNTFNGIRAQSVGGLVGRAEGEVASMTLCYAGGQVTMDSNLTAYSVGGLVGRGTVKEVKQCYAYMDMSRLTITKDAANNLYMDPNGNMRVYALAPVNAAHDNIDWTSCRYLGRGLPEGAAMDEATDGYGYSYGLPLFDSTAEVLDKTTGNIEETTISKSLGTVIGEIYTGDVGKPVNKSSQFPFQAVMKFDGKFYHYGDVRYEGFGQRPNFGLFMVYGNGNTAPNENDNNPPYYLFGVVENIPEGAKTGHILLAPDDQNSPTGVTKITAYGLMLPKGYKVESTDFISYANEGTHNNGGGASGTNDAGLIWYQRYYKVMDTNGNVIISDFTIYAGDKKPMAIYQEGADPQDYTIEASSNCSQDVKNKMNTLRGKTPLETTQIANLPANINDYSLFYFTIDSIAAIHSDNSGKVTSVNRRRGTFNISFSYNGTETIEFKFVNQDYPYDESNYTVTLTKDTSVASDPSEG